jgi:hypothetical protein
MTLTNFPKGATLGNLKYGQTVITGSGTAPTGLLGTPTFVVASLRNIGSAAGDPFTVQAVPIGGGSVVFTVRAQAGGTATNAGTVNYIAIGTPA